MEFLRKFILIAPLLCLNSCGDSTTITQVIKLRVDTFISSITNTNHSELDYLSLAKTSEKEERIILKLPTNDEKEDDLLDECFDLDNICSVFFMPLSILVRILTTCTDNTMTASNLTSAILVLNTVDGSAVSSGSLDINLLDKPWFNSVNWNRAHPFSKHGKWESPGGDMDTSTTFNTNCVGLSSGSCAAGEIKFEMTQYFKSLISSPNTTHYGMIIKPNTTMNEIDIHSVQAKSSLSPRLVATYTGSCSSKEFSETKVFYLGRGLDQ